MQRISGLAAGVLAILLAGCGGDNGSSPITSPAPTPTPTPTPTLTPTPTPTSVAAKLRGAAATGSVRKVADIGIVGTSSKDSIYATGVQIPADDPKIQLLGGIAVRGKVFPYSQGVYGQAITAGDPTTLSGTTGLPGTRYSVNVGYEFILPAGATSFEVGNLRAGTNQSIQVEINGNFVNEAGFDNGWDLVGPGNIIYTEFKFPALSAASKVKVYTSSTRAFMGLRLPTGGSVVAPTSTSIKANVVFQGDSITEGTGASQQVYSWIMQASFRLGIDNPINVGLGGSGYLRRRATSGTAGYNFRERIADVTKAIDGSPPDAVIVAGGINDCAVGAPFTAAETGAEALLYFQALRAAAPNMLIFVVGPFSDWNNPTYHPTTAACRDAIFEAAAQVSATYTIDMSNWVTAENRNTMFDSTKDKVHPLNAGHVIYGTRFAESYRTIINSLP